MSDENFDNFVGKKIEECRISGDRYTMFWKVDGQWWTISAEGDCCSRSWYEHCDNGEALQNATLNSFEDVDSDSFEEESEYIRINMLKFATNKGHCTIEFRNSSNGYYSGWCDFHKGTKPQAGANLLESF